MESVIANELSLKPMVILLSDEKPENALGPRKGPTGCFMLFLAKAFVDRKTAYTFKEAHYCGLRPGFGFGTGFEEGGEAAKEHQATFLSLGIESAKDKQIYEKRLEGLAENKREFFMEGERVFSDFETAYENISNRPIYNHEEKYIIFKPLEDICGDDEPLSVVFLVNSIELGALIQIDGSFRKETNYTITPQAAACQAIASYVWAQGEKEDSHAVLGLSDLAGRRNMKRWIPNDYLTYAVDWNLFLKLEELSKNSVFQTELWKSFKGE